MDSEEVLSSTISRSIDFEKVSKATSETQNLQSLRQWEVQYKKECKRILKHLYVTVKWSLHDFVSLIDYWNLHCNVHDPFVMW